MKERDVVKRLKKAAQEKVSCDEQEKNKMIAAVLEKQVLVRRTGGFGAFLASQFRFINKTVVLGQIMWLLLFSYAVWDGAAFWFSDEVLCILSMAPPILLLLTVDEVARVYNRSMLEIEYATKYSLKKVVMGRLLILSIVNGVLLAAGIMYAGKRIGLSLLYTLSYSLTPFVCMTFILLLVMKKYRGERLIYAGISVYAIFLCIVWLGRMGVLSIYNRSFLWIWITLLIGSAAGVGYQVRKLWKMLGNFELLID